MNKRLQKLVTDLLSIPTAPYHEHEVIAYIKKFAKRRDLTIREDRYGNVIVRYKQGRSRPVAISAHTDHPGFSVLSTDGRNIRAKWGGGRDPKHFPGGKVVIRAGKKLIRGKATSATDISGHFDIRAEQPVVDWEHSYGHFDLVPCEFRGDLIYTKAADNLINCAVLLSVLDQLNRKNVDADFRAVFTRAEEVGLAGATGLVKAKTLAKTIPIIVLEASKELPGAIMGSGPVIRVGDYLSVFDARLDFGMHQLAKEIAQSDSSFAYQRQLMSGGACEATLYAVNLRPVGALALPLGNYHNQGKRWPAPEYVSSKDVVNLVRLCAELCVNPPPAEPRRDLRKYFDKQFERRHEQRLIATRKPPRS
jgi:putative aminopeptidase FrvX